MQLKLNEGIIILNAYVIIYESVTMSLSGNTNFNTFSLSFYRVHYNRGKHMVVNHGLVSLRLNFNKIIMSECR